MEPNIRRVGYINVYPVAAGRAEPQLSGQLSGRPAVPGEPARVREARGRHRRTVVAKLLGGGRRRCRRRRGCSRNVAISPATSCSAPAVIGGGAGAAVGRTAPPAGRAGAPAGAATAALFVYYRFMANFGTRPGSAFSVVRFDFSSRWRHCARLQTVANWAVSQARLRLTGDRLPVHDRPTERARVRRHLELVVASLPSTGSALSLVTGRVTVPVLGTPAARGIG